DVMDEIKPFACMKSQRQLRRAPLPEQGIEMDAALAAFPDAQAWREIVVVKDEVTRQFAAGQRDRDALAVIGAGDDMDHVPAPGYGERPMPAKAGLRPLAGFAGIGGEQDLHRAIPASSCAMR